MKKLTASKTIECMACLQCVRACSEAYYKEFHPDKANIKIIEKNGDKVITDFKIVVNEDGEFAFTDEGVNSYRSEKDITIVMDSTLTTAFTSLISGVEEAGITVEQEE